MPPAPPDPFYEPTTPGVDPRMPRMVAVGDDVAPAAPAVLRDTGVDVQVLVDLALKAGFTVPSFTTDWASRRLHLPQVLVGDILDSLREERLLEVLGDAGPFGFRFGVTQRG